MLDKIEIKRDKQCREEIEFLSKSHHLDYDVVLKIYGHGYNAGNSHGEDDGKTDGYESGYDDGYAMGYDAGDSSCCGD